MAVLIPFLTELEIDQALYWQHKMARIKPPNKRDFEFLQTWMKTPSMGNVYLLGADSDIWEAFDATELACFRPTKTDSWMGQFITDNLIRWYHHLVGHFFRVGSLPCGALLNATNLFNLA